MVVIARLSAISWDTFVPDNYHHRCLQSCLCWQTHIALGYFTLPHWTWVFFLLMLPYPLHEQMLPYTCFARFFWCPPKHFTYSEVYLSSFVYIGCNKQGKKIKQQHTDSVPNYTSMVVCCILFGGDLQKKKRTMWQHYPGAFGGTIINPLIRACIRMEGK